MKLLTLKNLLSILFCFCIIILTGCSGNSGGAPRTAIDLEAYGLVTGSTVVDSKSYSVESLQAFLTPNALIFDAIGKDTAVAGTGICQSLVLYSLNFDYLFEPPVERYLGNGLCVFNFTAMEKITKGSPISSDLLNFVKNNKVGARSTKFYRFYYNTPGAPFVWGGGTTTPQNVSGLIIVPRDSNGNPLTSDKIKGVLLYFHQTISSKGGVPSDFDAPESSVNLKNALDTDLILAAAYASQGYVVVAPDYVGQGANPQVQHPYSAFGITNAQSGIYALKAARQALIGQGISLPIPANVYISSYSEGGAYALWASKLIQGQYGSVLANSSYQLRRTVGVHGAYDLSDTMLPYMFSNVKNSWNPAVNVWNVSPGMFESGLTIKVPLIPDPITLVGYSQLSALAAFIIPVGKVNLSGYLLNSLIYYNSTTAAYLTLSFPNYVDVNQCLNLATYASSMTTSPSANIEPCPTLPGSGARAPGLAGLFNDTSGLLNTDDISRQTLTNTLATNNFVTDGLSFSSLLTAMQSSPTQAGFSNNSITAFIHNIIGDQTVMQNIVNQDIFSWSSNSPLEIIYLAYDSIVPNINALKACGLAQGYAPGVKDLSPPGMVNCTQIDNTQLFQQVSFQGVNFGPIAPPLFADHNTNEAVSQIVALTKFLANP
jgi:hypothetical protein